MDERGRYGHWFLDKYIKKNLSHLILYNFEDSLMESVKEDVRLKFESNDHFHFVKYDNYQSYDFNTIMEKMNEKITRTINGELIYSDNCLYNTFSDYISDYKLVQFNSSNSPYRCYMNFYDVSSSESQCLQMDESYVTFKIGVSGNRFIIDKKEYDINEFVEYITFSINKDVEKLIKEYEKKTSSYNFVDSTILSDKYKMSQHCMFNNGVLHACSGNYTKALDILLNVQIDDGTLTHILPFLILVLELKLGGKIFISSLRDNIHFEMDVLLMALIDIMRIEISLQTIKRELTLPKLLFYDKNKSSESNNKLISLVMTERLSDVSYRYLYYFMEYASGRELYDAIVEKFKKNMHYGVVQENFLLFVEANIFLEKSDRKDHAYYIVCYIFEKVVEGYIIDLCKDIINEFFSGKEFTFKNIMITIDHIEAKDEFKPDEKVKVWHFPELYYDKSNIEYEGFFDFISLSYRFDIKNDKKEFILPVDNVFKFKVTITNMYNFDLDYDKVIIVFTGEESFKFESDDSDILYKKSSREFVFNISVGRQGNYLISEVIFTNCFNNNIKAKLSDPLQVKFLSPSLELSFSNIPDEVEFSQVLEDIGVALIGCEDCKDKYFVLFNKENFILDQSDDGLYIASMRLDQEIHFQFHCNGQNNLIFALANDTYIYSIYEIFVKIKEKIPLNVVDDTYFITISSDKELWSKNQVTLFDNDGKKYICDDYRDEYRFNRLNYTSSDYKHVSLLSKASYSLFIQSQDMEVKILYSLTSITKKLLFKVLVNRLTDLLYNISIEKNFNNDNKYYIQLPKSNSFKWNGKTRILFRSEIEKAEIELYVNDTKGLRNDQEKLHLLVHDLGNKLIQKIPFLIS